MADEISYTASLAINATNFVESFTPGKLSIDLASTAGSGGSQVIGTGHEAIAKGDTAAGGVAFFRNLDETNYVEIGLEVSSAFQPMVKLLAGEYALMRLATADVFAKANTANINLQYRMLSP
tara:strand:+ start:5450 stop:5815 length:366 start_codon:yes stop_codon:yes gene_type:complete